MQEPALSYLDVLVVGFALAQVLGRIGCLMVGCCHGRPGRWGVRYGERHSAAGYTHYLLGARLFPIPLIEAIWLLLLSLFGTARIVGSAYRPGEVLAWYVVAYGAVRFFLEFARADTDRLFWGGFSEAQWTAIAAMGVVVALERAAVLPARQWHAGAAAGLVAVMVAVALERRFSTASGHLLLHPYHLREVAGVVNWLLELADSQSETSDRGTIRAPVFSADTSLGFRISLSIRDGQPGGAYEYALACSEQRPKTHAMAALAKFIVRYRHAGCSYQTTRGDDGEVNLRISSGCGARTC